MKRNIKIIDDCNSCVIIETDRKPEEIKFFCAEYVKRIDSGQAPPNYSTIGKLLFDTELQNNLIAEAPEATETYFLEW